MNKKTIQTVAFVAFIAVAGIALYVGLSGNSTASSSGEEREARMVQILKYSDYSCPACKAYVPSQNELKREFGDKIQIEYRYFPLSGFQYSRLAAHSVEAANSQGKFKEMHDLVFENQQVWTQGNALEHFTNYANEIGLDMEQFEQDLESEEIHNRVESQRQEGIRRQVNATPTFFINGQKLRQNPNPQNYEQFKSIVELYMYRSN